MSVTNKIWDMTC